MEQARAHAYQRAPAWPARIRTRRSQAPDPWQDLDAEPWPSRHSILRGSTDTPNETLITDAGIRLGLDLVREGEAGEKTAHRW